MTSLLSRAQSPNSEGRIQNITPESADWKYVGFDFFKLKTGQTLKKKQVAAKFVWSWLPEKRA
jgi:5-deoxyglucuronate isomerase (EC 5.3.1.-)